jgi:hypothetical protein
MHTLPAINVHYRAMSFNRFMGMFNSIPQEQDHRFKPERWYVLSQCGLHIYSVVIYFCHFDKCIQYSAERVR